MSSCYTFLLKALSNLHGFLDYSHMTSSFFLALETNVFSITLAQMAPFLNLKKENLPSDFLSEKNQVFSTESPIISIKISPDEQYLAIQTSNTFSILAFNNIDTNRNKPFYEIKGLNKILDFQWHLLSRLSISIISFI